MKARGRISHLAIVELAKLCICTLHMKLRITEKLLKLECDAEYAVPSNDGVRKKPKSPKNHTRALNFSSRVASVAKSVKVNPPGWDQGVKGGPKTTVTKVLGVTGAAVDSLVKNFDSFLSDCPSIKNWIAPKSWKFNTHLWRAWGEVITLLDSHPVDGVVAAELLKAATHKFGQLFVNAFGVNNVTPYIHILVCHAHELMARFGDLNIRSQQGFEHLQQEQKIAFRNSSSRGGGRLQGKSSLNLQLMQRCFRSRWFANEEFKPSANAWGIFDHIDDSSFVTPTLESSSEDLSFESEDEEFDEDLPLEDLSDDEGAELVSEEGADSENSLSL